MPYMILGEKVTIRLQTTRYGRRLNAVLIGPGRQNLGRVALRFSRRGEVQLPDDFAAQVEAFGVRPEDISAVAERLSNEASGFWKGRVRGELWAAAGSAW